MDVRGAAKTNAGGNVSSNFIAVMVAALLYVGASHLLPEVEKENKRYSLIALLVGVLVAAMIVTFKR